jgi:hypothetical protein
VLKIDVKVYSETLITTSETAWCHDSENQNVNLKGISVIIMFNDEFCPLGYDAV